MKYHFENFKRNDLDTLKKLQPPDWGDIGPRFLSFIISPNCEPIKLMCNNQMVGVGTTIKHENSAWLACIIVSEEFRNQGLGKEITQKLIASLDPNKYTTIFLDATDLGYPVYEKLGFQMEAEYTHFKKNQEVLTSDPSKNISTFRPDDIGQILALDLLVSAEDRKHIILESLENARIFHREEEILGFYLPALGEGMIVAKEAEAGLALLEWRAAEKTNAALPSANEIAIAKLLSSNFNFFRKSRRMYLGEKRNWNPKNMYNRISGQLG